MKSQLNKLYSILAKKIAKIVILLVIAMTFLIPSLVSADSMTSSKTAVTTGTILTMNSYLARAGMPVPKTAPKKVITVTVTAYSSTPDQTDDTPCITANGYNLCKNNKMNIIAANFLPFGTKVKIPGVFGDQEFSVQDRMNKRFSQRMDIWMPTRKAALAFGIQTLQVEVY
jgi:3D (Asp-Asp-Asp) domain-containing protein